MIQQEVFASIRFSKFVEDWMSNATMRRQYDHPKLHEKLSGIIDLPDATRADLIHQVTRTNLRNDYEGSIVLKESFYT
jgi:hypothetical protein